MDRQPELQRVVFFKHRENVTTEVRNAERVETEAEEASASCLMSEPRIQGHLKDEQAAPSSPWAPFTPLNSAVMNLGNPLVSVYPSVCWGYKYLLHRMKRCV